MAKKPIIYCKQTGESPIPLTVRIKWHPDGRIEPLYYWTPDGTCYKVIASSESVPIEILKDGGEGLRFKVVGEIIETPEPDDELMHIQRETYLYLADDFFCQSNIIDARYAHAGKEYIPVILDVFPDCSYEVISFWARGSRYLAEKTLKVCSCGSFETGGIGIKHKLVARLVNAHNDDDPDPHNAVLRTGSIYLELNKWFVSVK